MHFEAGYTMTIDGRAVEGLAKLPVINPATEEIIGQAPDANTQDLDAAVAAGRRASASWQRTPISERKTLLGKVAERMQAHVEEFKTLLTREQGKPHADSYLEALYSAMWFSLIAQL